MDIRKTGWYGRLKVSGLGQEFTSEGSIMSIIGETLKQLNATNPRDLTDGRSITITITDKPIGSIDESILMEAALIEQALDGRFVGTVNPLEGEDIVAFIGRLEHEGYNSATAMYLARDAFGYDQDESLIHWVSDPQAQLFRFMNASDRSYEECDKEEYALLKRALTQKFPDQIDAMKLRG